MVIGLAFGWILGWMASLLITLSTWFPILGSSLMPEFHPSYPSPFGPYLRVITVMWFSLEVFSNIVAPSTRDDVIYWDNVDIWFFKAHKIWDSIRQRAQIVHGRNCFGINSLSLGTPSRLALRRRLPTNDLFSSYNNFKLIACPLCNCTAEYFLHLFFNCSYSKSVISTVMAIGNCLNVPLDWDSMVDYILQFNGRFLQSKVL